MTSLRSEYEKSSSLGKFISKKIGLSDYWRSIILFGRNVASYKFALAKSILNLNPSSGCLVKIEEIAPLYVKHIAEHLKKSEKQGTFKNSIFIEGCKKYNSGEVTENEVVDLAVRHGFNNVIDAFHIVGGKNIPNNFFIDERKKNKGIRVTDEFELLMNEGKSFDLIHEVEARWRLVETAWKLGVSRSLLSIEYDTLNEFLCSLDTSRRRSPLTGSREALNGYQKGKCFYCFSDISVDPKSLFYSDVDHFFPHALKGELGSIVDGVWNLVLACKECNRGPGGKFDRIPDVRLLERLHKRNEFLISSHHPLRETLILQTGSSEKNRAIFLNNFFNKARGLLIHEWTPVVHHSDCF